MEPLSKRGLYHALSCVGAERFGANLRYESCVGSTNDVARDLAERHAPEGTLVVANEQSAGRGRMGRTWVAPPGTSILMSVILRPSLPPTQASQTVMACGLAIAEAVEKAVARQVTVKWPNDLHLNDRKFAGILSESAIVGEQLQWVVVGMGINVSQTFAPPDPLAETATSLHMATGQQHDRATLIANIMAHLIVWDDLLGEAALLQAWRERCTTLGRRVVADTPQGRLAGLAQEIDETGVLWIEDDAGALHALRAGEVALVD